MRRSPVRPLRRALLVLLAAALVPVAAPAAPGKDGPPPELTDPEELFWEGFNRLHGRGRPKDPASSTLWFAPAAEQGHLRAQVHMAVAYEKGRGVERDDERALEFYVLPADAGHAKAQYEAGRLLLLRHQSSPEHRAEAAKWLILALHAGSPLARVQVPPLLKQLRKVDRREGMLRARAWREERGLPVPELTTEDAEVAPSAGAEPQG